MQKKLQALFNFVHDNFGQDKSIIGLSGFRDPSDYCFIEIPKELKKTNIQKTENNYLLI